MSCIGECLRVDPVLDKPQVPKIRKTARERWLESLAWDGLLPLGLAALTFGLRIMYPDDDSVQLFALIILPMFAAMARAAMGAQQLQRFTGSSIWWRQVLLALAIFILLIMEATNAAISFTKNAPLWIWLIPAGIYVCYLPVVMLAFWRFTKTNHP